VSEAAAPRDAPERRTMTPDDFPAPEALAEAFDEVGLSARLVVERKDGKPLSSNERAAVRAIVACHDVEHLREVSDDEVMAAVAVVLERGAKKADDAAQ
jgi:hypothetical protein